MRKQLARAGVVAVAAMMLTTTAFAAEITDVKYTGINEVTVTVPTAAGAETSLLAVTGAKSETPTVTDGKNIAYIDQGKTDSSVVALAENATLEFKFNTQGPAARVSNGSIDVFSAYQGGTELASVLTVKEMAPAASVALELTESVKVNETDNDAALKAALAGKAKLVFTHEFEGANAENNKSEIPVTAEMAEATFAINAEKTGIDVTFTPSATTPFEAKADTTLTANVAEGGNLTIEEEPQAPIVVTKITLTASDGTDSGDPVELQNLVDDEWDNDLAIKRLKKAVVITAKYEVQAGSPAKEPAPVTDTAEYAVKGTGVAGDPYVFTVTYKENSGVGGAPVISTNTLTLYAVKGTPTSTVAISGTVKTKDGINNVDYTLTQGALVAAYDATTGAFAGAAVTDASGAFEITVADAEATYLLQASYASLLGNQDEYMTLIYNAPVTTNVKANTPVEIQMAVTYGDTNGDGVVNSVDLQNVKDDWTVN